MKYKYDIYNALILTFVVIFGAIRNISLPGLYADAINPDYFVNYFFHNTFKIKNPLAVRGFDNIELNVTICFSY